MNEESACFLSPSPKQICHPDRSVAEWRDLLSVPPITTSRGQPLPSPLSSRVADLPGGKSRME
jgi:hypothetical protein